VTKILIIEDSKPMSRFLHRCLEGAGFEVEEWLPASAQELPEHLRSSAPDLILSDYFMPGLDGAAVAQSACAARPKIPVVMLTCLEEEETIRDLFRLGVNQVINKPIEPEVVVQSVQDALADRYPEF